MLAVVNEKQLTEEQSLQFELEELAPEKFDPEIEFRVNKEHSNLKKESPRYRAMTMEECARLIAASNTPFKPPEPTSLPKEYPTYTREQVQELLRGHFEYKNKNKKEGDKWDSQKTTESEAKTETTRKRSKSTKA